MSSKGINSKVILQANAQRNCNDSCSILDSMAFVLGLFLGLSKKNTFFYNYPLLIINNIYFLSILKTTLS